MLTTETALSTTTEDPQQTVGRIAESLELLQRELQQARDVWQTTLSGDTHQSRQSSEELEHRWRQQEADHLTQSAVLEKRVAELEEFFQSQLKTTEDHTHQAFDRLHAQYVKERAEWDEQLKRAQADGEKLQKELEAVRAATVPQVAGLERELAASRDYFSTTVQALQEKITQAEAEVKARQESETLLRQQLQDRLAMATSEEARLRQQAHEQRSSWEAEILLRRQLQDRLASFESERLVWENEKQTLTTEIAEAQRVQQQRDAMFNRQREEHHTANLELQRLNSGFKLHVEQAQEAEQLAKQSLAAVATEFARYKNDAERDKYIWQQSLAAKIQEMHDREAYWSTQFSKQDYVVAHLQDEALEFQRRFYDLEHGMKQAHTLATVLVPKLEAQTMTLMALVQTILEGYAHPRRRKTDFVNHG